MPRCGPRRSCRHHGSLRGFDKQPFTIEHQLTDRIMDVREREVGGLLLEAGRVLWRPAARQFLHRADIEIAVVEVALQLRHQPREETAVLADAVRSEEHTSELQSRENLVCRLLLEKKKTRIAYTRSTTIV